MLNILKLKRVEFLKSDFRLFYAILFNLVRKLCFRLLHCLQTFDSMLALF